MGLPDCYDPVYQEDRRQREWDKFVENLPVCGCCGRSVYPNSVYYELDMMIKKETIIVCEACKSDLDESERILDM